jgi:Tfp pilus assembly protein PilV
MVKNQAKQKGLSIIEVIISMGMLLALFVLYATAINTTVATKSLRFQNYAYHVANKQMELLRGTALAALPSSGTISDDMLSEIPSGAGNFTVSNHATFTGVKEIIVTVTWVDRGMTKQVQLKTLAGSGGINQ